MVVAQIIHGPVLYNLGNNEVVLWWETDLVEGPNKVQWWKSGVSAVDVTAITTSVRDEFGTERYVHRVTLTGLTAGTVHSYKIFAFNYEDAVTRTFTTYRDTGSSVKIGVFGNPEGNLAGPSVLPSFEVALNTLNSLGVAGYVTTGGLVSDGDRYGAWADEWLATMGSDLRTKGLSGARGETDGFSPMSRAMFPMAHASNSYAVHSIGKARFAFLNSVPGVARNSLRISKEQANWLLDDVVRTTSWKTSDYRVIVVHHPWRTTFWNDSCQYGTVGTEASLMGLHELVKLSGADLVLYGYSRSYQRGAYDSTYQNNPHQIVHIVTGGGGAPAHDNRCWRWAPPEEPGIVKDTADYAVLSMDISAARLRIDAYDLATTAIIDSVSIVPHTLF